MVQLSHPYVTTGKSIALTIWAVVGKVMSLLFKTLSRFVIAFHPRSRCLLISWLQSPSLVILKPKKIKSFPFFLHLFALKWWDWMLSFKADFSLSSFTFKRLFSSSLLSAIRVVSSASLRLLLFLLAILIPTCASSSLAFYTWCTLHNRLNKQSDNIQPWCTPFPIWNQPVVPCPF